MFKKNWYLFTPLIIVAIPGLIWAFYLGSYGYTPAEATQALRHFLDSSTRYAQGYSAERFNRIRAGSDGGAVFRAIGVPFERHDNDAEWIYSLPKGSTPYYHQRKVLFARDKNQIPRVTGLVKDFHTP
ncbi:MAG: hypothetical protein U0984_11015 [Prosthecobacter sp.]|nr:hypothetical protein [Prosthecobacter sp.]